VPPRWCENPMALCPPAVPSTRRRTTPVCLASLLAVALLSASAAGQEPPAASAAALALFREQVRPVLTGQSLTCHASDKKRGGLAGRPAPRLVPHADRRLRPRRAGAARPGPRPGGRPPDAAAPRRVRPDRAAADAGGARRLRPRPGAGRLRAARGPAAGLAGL